MDEQPELGVVGEALEREHREIDEGIEAFAASQQAGEPDASHLERALTAMRRHIYLEEEFLFPPMQKSLAIPTMVMLREHGEIWRNVDSIEEQLAESGPSDGVVETCRELLARLAAHNDKEEPIFYTQTDVELSGEENEDLMAFIKSGAMPPGWICAKAIEPEAG